MGFFDKRDNGHLILLGHEDPSAVLGVRKHMRPRTIADATACCLREFVSVRVADDLLGSSRVGRTPFS